MRSHLRVTALLLAVALPVLAQGTDKVPLIDLGAGTYAGFTGGLYPNGSNTPPADHAAEGQNRARAIRPLDRNGNPDPNGKYVLLSIGMSNTSHEFCGRDITVGCWPGTFIAKAAGDPAVNHTSLVIVNGAQGGRDSRSGHRAGDRYYTTIATERLAKFGVTDAQVQIVWLKQANIGPRVGLPSPDADAYVLERNLGAIVRALKAQYPNLQQVFISSRIYAGYAPAKETLNPEPYAYESGFSVKWLVEAQIEQMRSGRVDPTAGDLDYRVGAPWIGWGPYLWANGMSPRSDGLTWEQADFADDGTHPSAAGVAKVSAMLLDFFKTSPYTRCWFVEGETCSPLTRRRSVRR